MASLDLAGPASRDSPTYALIDIDPGEVTPWDDVLVLARLHRTALEHLGVRAAAKLTGRRGIHIWIPVTDGLSFHDTRAWTAQLSKAIGAVVPELVSWKWDRSDRGGRARLDYTQNVHHKTLVAPYSPRAAARRPGLRADQLGRARRPVIAARRFHHPQRARARGRARRPVPHRAGPSQPLPPIR